MATGDETISPHTAGEAPLPLTLMVREMVPRAGPSPPTPALVLRWIAAAGGQPWFPSRHATETGTDRDSLDDPLNQLRLADLVRITTWERGVGQGYVLTPEGEQAVASGVGIPGSASKPAEPVHSNSEPAVAEKSDAGMTGFEKGEAAYLGLDPRPPLVTIVLVIANVLWYFVGVVAAIRAGIPFAQFLTDGNNAILHRTGGLRGFDLVHDDWWRLLSACFVHADVWHVLMNLVGLAVIGPLTELLWGRWRLVIIYVFSGLAGSCMAMALRPEVMVVGGFGAIWGVMTAAMAWFIMFRDRLKPDVAFESLRRLGLAILLNAGISFLPGISWEGHLGGAIAGFVVAGLLNAIRFSSRWRRVVALVLLLAIPVASVGGLVATMKWGDTWAEIRHREAAVESARAIAAALASFNRDVAPLLDRLNPESVRPVEDRAVWQLVRPGERRNAATVTAIQTELRSLKATADEAIGHLDITPSGNEAIDRHMARAKEFAEAKSRSFELLLDMLNSTAIPDPATWTTWGDARRTADNLWKGIGRP